MEKKRIPISDESQIPPGSLRLADFGCRGKNSPGSAEYVILQKAWERGEISGVKLMKTVDDKRGDVYLNKDEAEAILRRAGKAASASQKPSCEQRDSQIEVAVDVLREIHESISRMHATLQELSKVVEDMATSPKQ